VLDARAPAAVGQDAATQRPVEVVGTLAIGAREEPDGRVSLLRLTVDAAPPGAARNRGA
jgi:hypothetical protein